MSDDVESWQRMVTGLRAGEHDAVREFWDHYGGLMHALAEQHLAAGLRRRVGPEDVVQSVCRTFFRRARGGEFELTDGSALGALLCAITLTKVREQARFHNRAKRGLGREIPLSPPPGDTAAGPGLRRLGPAGGPSPAKQAEFAEQFRLLIDGLDDEQRKLVGLKLDGMTNEQAAERLGCSERTVRRLMKQVQSRLGSLLEAGEDAE